LPGISHGGDAVSEASATTPKPSVQFLAFSSDAYIAVLLHSGQANAKVMGAGSSKIANARSDSIMHAEYEDGCLVAFVGTIAAFAIGWTIEKRAHGEP
jgi:hypothetical protein